MAKKRSSVSRADEIKLRRHARSYKRRLRNLLYLSLSGFFIFITFVNYEVLQLSYENFIFSYRYIYTSVNRQLDSFLGHFKLPIHNIEVMGTTNVKQDLIVNLAQSGKVGQDSGPIYIKSLQDIRASILQIPIVKDVVVSRNVAKKLLQIRIDEHRIVGIVNSPNNPDNLMLVTSEGLEIEGLDYSAQFGHSIIVKNCQNYYNFLSLYNSLVSLGIQDLVFLTESVSNRRWNVIFKNGLMVKLPARNWDLALKDLVDLNAKMSLFLLSSKVKNVDLRVRGRVFFS